MTSPQPTDPLVAVLERMEARLDRLEARLARLDPILDQAAPMAATAVDILDDLAGRAADAGIDFDARARVLLRAAERLTSPEAAALLDVLTGRLDRLRDLFDSGLLAHGSVDVVSKAGDALAASTADHPEPVGVFGLLRALRDPDVARALGFLVQFARHFGKALEPDGKPLATRDAPALPAHG